MSTLREYAAGVLSALSRTQGGNKKAIVQAGGVKPLVEMLSDPSIQAQRHAACALWGLAEGKEGIYDKEIVEAGAVEPLIAMLMLNHVETRGFAAACLSCCCADDAARLKIVEAGGTEPLLALAHSPMRWLRTQAIEMLHLLGVPFHEPGELTSPRHTPSPRSNSKTTEDGNSKPFIIGSKMIAQKFLPIRVNKNIEREKENAVVGALEKGDVVYVIERQQLIDRCERAEAAACTARDACQRLATKLAAALGVEDGPHNNGSGDIHTPAAPLLSAAATPRSAGLSSVSREALVARGRSAFEAHLRSAALRGAKATPIT